MSEGGVYRFLMTCERLDTAINRWVSGPAITVGRTYFGLAVFRGQLWAVGGDGADGALSSCEYLDVATNTWMAGPPLNAPRYGHGLAVLNGQLWAVGGRGADGGALVSTCECLNEHVGRTRASNAWVVAGLNSFPLNFGVRGLCVAVI